MPTRYALTHIPYTLKEIQLGSFIPSTDRPNQDAYGPQRRLREDKDYRWRDEKNPEFSLDEEGQGSIKANLTRFLSLRGEKTNTHNAKLTAKEGRIYQLVDPKVLFRSLIKAKPCRYWLTQAHDEGEDVHFVVGYRTYRDVSQNAEVTKDTKAGGNIELPVGDSLGDPAASTPSGSALNPRLEGDASKHTHETESSDLPGERIFAICLRRVRFDWFKSKDSPPARLEKDNCWVVTSLRGADSPDAIEVDLEESFGAKSEVIAQLVTEEATDEFVIVKVDEQDD